MAGAWARRLHKSTRAVVACGACLPARAAPSSRARRTLRTSLVSLRLGQASSLSTLLPRVPPARPPRPSTGPGDPDPSESTGCPATPKHGSLFKQTLSTVIGFRFELCAAASASVFCLGLLPWPSLFLPSAAGRLRRVRHTPVPPGAGPPPAWTGEAGRVARAARAALVLSVRPATRRMHLQLHTRAEPKDQQRPSRHDSEAPHCVRGFKGQP